MKTRAALLWLVWCFLGLAAFTQPMPDETWLTVRVVKDDGTPFPAAQVVLYRHVGASRVMLGRRMDISDNQITTIGIKPETCQLVLSIPSYGLEDGPKTIELMPGANEYTWRLPPLIPLRGEMLLDGKPAIGVQQAQVYLMQGGKGQTSLNATLRNGAFGTGPFFPGEYRLLVLTDAGFAFTTVKVPAREQKDGNRDEKDAVAVSCPVPLLPAGTVHLFVTDGENHALPEVNVTLRGEIEKGQQFSLSLRTDKIGGVVLLPLPPGAWQWTAVLKDYKTATGTLDVKTDSPTTFTISLVKP